MEAAVVTPFSRKYWSAAAESWRALLSTRFILRGLAHLLERGNGHGGQEADDDHDDHDFNERKS